MSGIERVDRTYRQFMITDFGGQDLEIQVHVLPEILDEIMSEDWQSTFYSFGDEAAAVRYLARLMIIGPTAPDHDRPVGWPRGHGSGGRLHRGL